MRDEGLSSSCFGCDVGGVTVCFVAVTFVRLAPVVTVELVCLSSLLLRDRPKTAAAAAAA